MDRIAENVPLREESPKPTSPHLTRSTFSDLPLFSLSRTVSPPPVSGRGVRGIQYNMNYMAPDAHASSMQAHAPPRQAGPIQEPSRPCPGPGPMGGSHYRGPKPRIGHFNPDELTRRLHAVLDDQHAHAERKRRAARADATADAPLTSNPPPHRNYPPWDEAPPAEYHHTPREAAKQFTRTTTVELMREHAHVHELHKRALKLHMDGRAARTPDTTVGPELARAMRQNQEHRRSHFHQRRGLSDATAAMASPGRSRHTFEGGRSRMGDSWRRNSTGNAAGGLGDSTEEERQRQVLVMMEAAAEADASDNTTPPEEPVVRYPAHEHRVDWTQSDEPVRKPRLLPPLLRKADSLWGLRGRLGSKGGGSRHEGGTETGGLKEQESPNGNKSPVKSPRSRFFAKFIR